MFHHLVCRTDFYLAIIAGFDIELATCADTTQGNNQQGHYSRDTGTKQQADCHAVKDRVVQNGKGACHQCQGSDKDRTHAQLRASYGRFLDLTALGDFYLHEFNNQDGLPDNDATQRDHANHGCGRKFGTHNPVAGDDTHHGDGYRRHNQACEREVLELPDDQTVNQDQCCHECAAHVAEGLVGDRPFSGPLITGYGVVRGRAE